MPSKNVTMKNKFYLPGLNPNKLQDSLSFTIYEDLLPMSYMFYYDTSAFYRTYCEGFDNFKLREKRFLNFETPNRALITHEYDVKIDSSFKYDKFYYLFNPTEKLSWLKISQEGKRLSVAEKNTVKEIVKDIILDELKTEFTDFKSKFEELWNKKKGLPCFIKLEDTNYQNFLLTASYYDSIKRDQGEKKSKILPFFSPLLERQIKYEYFPLKNKSSWLYIKSPDNFNIKYNHKETVYIDKNNDIDYANSNNEEADPEKISLTIRNKKDTTTLENTVNFNFDIVVPPSLKAWFLTIYYLSLILLLLLLGYILNAIYISLWSPVWNINPLEHLFQKNDFGGFVLAIIAAIIATRGWLISEETILKKYSINITVFMVLIVLFYIISLFI